MATIEECRAALDKLAERISAGREGDRKPPSLDRSLSCYLTDLDAGFGGRLVGGELREITEGHDPTAKIKLSSTSDDLVALTNGELSFASAWASGRVKVDASVFDLLKLRAML
jgi:putative sterol carrier protein